jgi:hypothetical protein
MLNTMSTATKAVPASERTRRLAWWSLWLLLLSLAVPFVALGLSELHDRLDPPGPGLDFLPRTVNYARGTYFVFGAIQFASLGSGMWVARRCRRILWRLVPQRAIVCSLSGVINSFFVANTLKEVGLLAGATGDVAANVIACLSIAGSPLATGLWTWWVLTPGDSDWLDDPSMTHTVGGTSR